MTTPQPRAGLRRKTRAVVGQALFERPSNQNARDDDEQYGGAHERHHQSREINPTLPRQVKADLGVDAVSRAGSAMLVLVDPNGPSSGAHCARAHCELEIPPKHSSVTGG